MNALPCALILGLALAAPAPAADGEPKLTLEQASAQAKQAVKGGSVERAELARQEGRLVWDVDVRVSSAVMKEVWLDADTGAVERVETLNASDQAKAYAESARQQLDSLQKKIDELRRRAGPESEKARREADQRAAELETKAREAQKQLDELEKSGQERWRRFKAGLDRALIELRRGYDAAVSSGTTGGAQPNGRR